MQHIEGVAVHDCEESNRSTVGDSWESEIHPFGRSLIEAKPLHSGYYTVRRIDANRNVSMKDPIHSVTTFCIHMIAVPGPQRRPKVRMVFVATGGAHAVYEGQGSWSKCVRWIQQLPSTDLSKPDLAAAKREFGRNQYATLPEVRASLLDLESLGLQRVDR